MDYKDYYKILGVDKNASEKEIKQAYRKLARQYHPDVNPNDKASEAKFKEINEAYEVLGDAENRKKYDELGPYFKNGANPFSGGNPFQNGNFTYEFNGNLGDLRGFSDFFSAFFGGKSSKTGRANINDLFGGASSRYSDYVEKDREIQLELTLEEAVSGAERTFQVPVYKPCNVCGGTGFLGGVSVCSACRGAGRISKNSMIDVKIPAGVRNGSKIKVENYLLTVKILPHKYFEIQGADLIEKIPISITEAVLGAEIDVPTLQGKLSVKIPPMTQTGKKLRLPGYGLPSIKGKPGDLYIEMKVVAPDKITSKEKSLFEELAKLSKFNPRTNMYKGK